MIKKNQNYYTPYYLRYPFTSKINFDSHKFDRVIITKKSLINKCLLKVTYLHF